MNLYKITVGHAAPKDWCKTMIGFVLAENDEQMYEYIASEPTINGHYIINSWNDKDEEDEESPADFRKRIIEIKGEINDEGYDFSDSYYGITLYGWELMKENIGDHDQLLSFGIAQPATIKPTQP